VGVGGDDVLQIRRLPAHGPDLVEDAMPVGIVEGVNQRDSIAVIQQESVHMAAEGLAYVVNAIG
jgi:hypothetical protein